MTIPTHQNESDFLAHYDTLKTQRFIKFEGRLYAFKNTTVNGVERIRKYRCEQEQHTLNIHLFSDAVVKVDAYYKIEVTEDAVHRASEAS